MSLPITRNEAIIEHIISFVPPQDIPVLMGVCRRWARIIRGPTICTILFQHRFPGLPCDRCTVCAEWLKQKQLDANIYANLKARRFTTSPEELRLEYDFLGDQLYSRARISTYPAHIFKEFIVARIFELCIFNQERQLLRSYGGLSFLGIEEEGILCWDSSTRKIISIDARLNLHISNIYCDGVPVLWGHFLYYHDRRSTGRIIQIDRRDPTRVKICSPPLPEGVGLYPSGSLLYCSCFDYPRRWATVIDMQTGTLVGEVDNRGVPVGCDKDRYFTLSDDNVLQAYNKRGELEQTYRGIQERLSQGARVTSFNHCIVYISYKYVLTGSTYIWNSKTGQLLATFPYQFVREDQGKLYFLDRSMEGGQLIIYDCTQSDPMQI